MAHPVKQVFKNSVMFLGFHNEVSQKNEVNQTLTDLKEKIEELHPKIPNQCSNETYSVLNSADRNYQFKTIGDLTG